MKRLLAVCVFALFAVSAGRPAPGTPEYSIQAIRYATLPGFPVAGLVMGCTKRREAGHRDGHLADSRRRSQYFV